MTVTTVIAGQVKPNFRKQNPRAQRRIFFRTNNRIRTTQAYRVLCTVFDSGGGRNVTMAASDVGRHHHIVRVFLYFIAGQNSEGDFLLRQHPLPGERQGQGQQRSRRVWIAAAGAKSSTGTRAAASTGESRAIGVGFVMGIPNSGGC